MSEDEKKAKRSKKATTNGTVGLFDPMTLRGMTVRNRIWLPPMDTYSSSCKKISVLDISFRLYFFAHRA